MSEQAYPVTRDSGTSADVFTAVGLADLLATASGAAAVRLTEEASRFVVWAGESSTGTPALGQRPGYPYLQVKNEAIPDGVSDWVSYLQEKERVDLYRRTRRENRGQPSDPAVLAILQQNQPRPDWSLLQAVRLLGASTNTNKVHELVQTMDGATYQAEVNRAIGALIEGASSGLKWKITSVQLFNPNAAKGYGLLKPAGTDRNNKTKEQWTDPFVEWLRYRGFFSTAAPFILGSDIRVLVPVPAEISLASLRSVAAALRASSIFGSAPKLDTLATLRLAEILIDHSEFAGDDQGVDDDLRVLLGGKTPADVVSGVAITHFQSLGQARAVSQLATLALPGWFPILGPADVSDWRLILDEHRRVLRSLRDDRSERSVHPAEIGLVITYRQFLERRGQAALDTLLDFMGAYGAYLPGARDRGRRLPAFTTVALHRIVEGLMPGYLEILDDPGFRAVADAIRRATVSAQALKARGADHREIRYELLHEIRRKRLLPGGGPLLETIADFIASYNYENARRREMKKMAPRNVTTAEFEGLTRLVERDAPLVGAMLAAYGSCRLPQEVEATADSGGGEDAEMTTDVDTATEDEEE